MKKVSIIYITLTHQTNNIDWVYNNAVALSEKYKLLYICLDQKTITFKNFISPTYFTKTISSLYSLIKKNFTQWLLFEPLPFKRFSFINHINHLFSIKLLKFILRKYQIVVIFSIQGPPPEWVQLLEPDLVIYDITDYWFHRKILSYNSKVCALSNSLPIYKLHKKYFSNIYLIPAGYYSDNQIKLLSKKKWRIRGEKTIIIIGTVSHRINPVLILYLAKKMPEYTFVLIGYENFKNPCSEKDRQLNSRIYSKWLKLNNLPNFRFIPIVNQTDLLKINIKAGAALLPTDPRVSVYELYSNPFKLYHYLAVGLPIVSFPLLNLNTFNYPFLKVTHNRRAIIQALKAAANQKLSLRQRKQMNTIAFDQTIERKVKDIECIIEWNLS